MPKKHKSSLNNSHFFLENIILHVPHFIFWKDKNSVYLGCNENYAKLLGLKSPSEIVGKTDFELGWQADGHSAEFFRQKDQEVLNGKSITNLEQILSSPNHEKMIVSLNKVPLMDDSGEVIGILGVSTDITKQKQKEHELLMAKEMAESSVQGIKIIASSMAHELRTPLASISACMYGIKEYLPTLVNAYQLARQAGLSTEKIRENHFQALTNLSQTIENEIHYSNTMINMLLMNANSTQPKSTELTICSIAKCIEQAIARYPFKSEKEAQLIHWQNGKDFLFKGNELFVIHMLFNLIKNALYYIEETDKGEIYLTLENKQDNNLLHFKDTSKGIAAENLPKIFDTYFSDKLHGAGIGLAFCKRVMEIFFGSIICYSEQGQYTDFVLCFPAIK